MASRVRDADPYAEMAKIKKYASLHVFYDVNPLGSS